ncbi:MAG TPA: urease accessory protein UreD [Pseudorhodoplanes sp.]|nr:urease accessory protein UreD [Pseudorhodoplanes sp.]
MSLAASRDKSSIFAANRARGEIALTVAIEDGRTRRRRVRESGSLRARFPNVAGGELEAVIVNSAGGIAGGDRFSLDIAAGEKTRLLVSGAAAEKVYRSAEADTEISVRLAISAGAALRWLPQETILFDRARLRRQFEIDMAADSSLVLAEAVVFGRAAMGEKVERGRLIDRWRLRRGGRLVFAETMRLDGAIGDLLAQPAVANGAGAMATILFAPADDAAAARLRAVEYSAEVGISAWNGIALARFCAPDGAALRRDVAALLAALDRGAPPRLWLN